MVAGDGWTGGSSHRVATDSCNASRAGTNRRTAPMTSKCTAQLLADLGVTRSLSRPQVSDDNPFSEAQVSRP